MMVVWKKYCIDTLVKELGINNVNSYNPKFIPTDDTFETILKGHNQFITSVGFEMSEEDQNLLYKGYFTHDIYCTGDNMNTANNVGKIIDFLINNIFVQLEGVFSVR